MGIVSFYIFKRKAVIFLKYSAIGVPKIVCPCCENDTFKKDFRQLNSAGLTFFGLDWANKEATILICNRCSYILWFMHQPIEMKNS